MTDQWVVIPNWDRFQHYSDRDPAWIKVYRSLMTNPDFLGLTGHQTGVLCRLWLEYAASNGQARADTRSMSRQLSLKVSTETLDALKAAGFLKVRASRPLALTRARERGGARSREKEKEIDTPKSPHHETPETDLGRKRRQLNWLKNVGQHYAHDVQALQVELERARIGLTVEEALQTLKARDIG